MFNKALKTALTSAKCEKNFPQMPSPQSAENYKINVIPVWILVKYIHKQL